MAKSKQFDVRNLKLSGEGKRRKNSGPGRLAQRE